MAKIALIDSDSLLYISLYNKKSEEPKTLDECKEKLDEMITNILKFTHSTHYLLTLTIGKNFRYDIRTDYKSGRKSEKPNFFNECRNYLVDSYGAIWDSSLESDDLVNIYKNSIPDSFICACDSDILQGLKGKHFNYKTFKWITIDKKSAEYKFWHDMIAGTHNGIKGIPGKGTKFAEQLLDFDLEMGFDSNWYTYKVLKAYMDKWGEELGIQEFYKNYSCMKIKDKWEGLTIPEPRKFEKRMNEYEEEYKQDN